MKKIIWVVLGLVVAVLALAASGCDSFGPAPLKPAATGGNAGQNTGIWVTGEGKVTVVPDVAILSVGVQAQEASVARAQAEASTAMNAVISELKSAGVADKDIKTQSFNIQQLTRWDNDKQQPIVIGYQVNNVVTARVRQVNNTGAVLDAIARAGGDFTRVNGISFTVDDPSPFQKQARQKAMADAGAKARQLADSAGVKLGAPLYINESGGNVPIPYLQGAMAAAGPVPAPAPPPISPGEMDITLNVQVVYEIR